ncbi:mRNA surveillance protein pelota [Candidatus Woesearchaeota archaeon]|nr:mRNA surveillance protein pelota [Candidatus Woesearchaeota archaeon]
MRIIQKDIKAGTVKVQTENADDLWYLSGIIGPGDRIRGKTLRKIKIGEEPNIKVVRKPVSLTIRVEKTEYQDTLRATGTITQGPEDVPLGSHHSFNIDEDTTITLMKDQWLSYMLERLNEAVKNQNHHIILAVFDREEAHFAKLTPHGYDYLSSLYGNVNKKQMENANTADFYKEITSRLLDLDERFKPIRIVAASPAFYKDELTKSYDAGLSKKTIFATCASVGKNAFDEVIKREEVQQALHDERTAQEAKAVDDLLTAIAKDAPATYGKQQVRQAADAGAITLLLISDKLLGEEKEKGTYAQIDAVMKLVEQTKGKILIISHEHEGGQKLSGLGGIGALLRYKIA